MKPNKWIEHFEDPLKFTAQFAKILSKDGVDDLRKDEFISLWSQIYRETNKHKFTLNTKNNFFCAGINDVAVLGSTTDQEGYPFYATIPLFLIFNGWMDIKEEFLSYQLDKPGSTRTFKVKIRIDSKAKFSNQWESNHRNSTNEKLFIHAPVEVSAEQTFTFQAKTYHQLQEKVLQKVAEAFITPKTRSNLIQQFKYMTDLNEDFQAWLATRYH